MEKKCPHCGTHDNPPEYEFCKYDGFELVEETVATAAPTKAPAPSVLGSGSDTAVSQNNSSRSGSTPFAAAAAKAKVIVMKNGQPSTEFAISGEQAVIGRWDAEVGAFPEIDLTDEDPGAYISRHHARIYLNNGRYYIEDLGSSNKTIVNKSNKLNPHAPAELKSGDEIIVGKTFLKFVIEY